MEEKKEKCIKNKLKKEFKNKQENQKSKRFYNKICLNKFPPLKFPNHLYKYVCTIYYSTHSSMTEIKNSLFP